LSEVAPHHNLLILYSSRRRFDPMPRWIVPQLPELLRLRRSRWPLVVLLLSIGLTALAAIEAQRSVRGQQALADRALKEYAGFAAWSYAQHFFVDLNQIEREAIGAVNHGDATHTSRIVPTARDLDHYLPWDAGCMCHRAQTGPSPDAFFAVNLGHPAIDVDLNTHEGAAGGWQVDSMDETHMAGMAGMGDMPSIQDPDANHATRAESERLYPVSERQWTLDSLTKRVRGLGEIDRGFTLVVGTDGKMPRAFICALMPTSWGDTMVYGARYSEKAFRSIMESVLDSPGLLPAAFSEGRRNRDILALRVRDHAGRTLFESSPGRHITYAETINLPSRGGQLAIDAVIRPELAGTLLVGGLPRSRLPFLLGLLGLAAAMSIVAVAQLRREGDLARVRGDFVSSVSHELRTPLAQIRLYVETMQLGRAATEEQQQWSLSHIARETTRLSHLVENVLRFSTLGRDDPTERVEVDIGTEAARIANDFAPLAASRRATVRVDIEPTPPAMLRPDALRHVILNLLDNAVKYGPPGQTVTLKAYATSASIVVAVDDQGPGVSVSERESIWAPFNRGKTAQTNGGSGIGLTIVREIAEAHGGTAMVERAPGGGARFSIAFPTTSVPVSVS
jgi:signal transduction histidine kinase